LAKENNTYHHGDLRQALIDGAIALIAQQDIGHLSLREVARQVGVSHAAPYRHFQDKEDLLAAVGEQGFIGLTQAMESGIAQSAADPLVRLKATGVAYVQFAVTHPAHYRVMFGSFSAEQLPHPNRAQAGWQSFQVLLNSIEAGQQAGVLRGKDPMQLAWVAWATVHGLALLLIDQRLPVTQPEAMTALAEFVTQTLIEGLVRSRP
jgi:AcrR family transcriptional regulator